MNEILAKRVSEIKKRIEIAADKVNREPYDIKLVAVSKTHPIEIIREGIRLGICTFGENKVQEGIKKIAEIGRDKAEWHLIGHLQKNKARKTIRDFDVIQTLDSLGLAKRLERICREEKREELSVLVQVNLAGENTKSGITEMDLPDLLGFLRSCNHLKLDGLMVIPPYFAELEKVRPYFKKLRKIRDNLEQQDAFANGTGELSMGMSHDFEVAIEEGATIVRIGTAIFGERQKFK